MITPKLISACVCSSALLYGMLHAQVEADDFNPATVKTIHIHYHGNFAAWIPGTRMLKLAALMHPGCKPPYPHPPVPITLFPDPGNVNDFTDSQTDTYWSGTHLAEYSTSTEYKLNESCEWTTYPAYTTGEIDDYKTRTHITIDYLHKSLSGVHSLYVEPEPALRLREDADYAATIIGTDSAAGQKCDVVIDEPFVSKQFPVVASNALKMSDLNCVLSSLHRFPGTNNWIHLKSSLVMPATDVPADKVGTRTQGTGVATVFEVNVPIPADKFIPPNFPFIQIAR